MVNIPEVKLGIISVSRSAFPRSLAERRRDAIAAVSKKAGLDMYICPTVVESELDVQIALKDIAENGVNALIVFLGNFGPETPETMLAKYFDGPVMYCAAAEEDIAVLKEDRGDAYCGMLNCSYNMALRKVKAYIPSYPVGDAEDVVSMIKGFIPVARALIGVKNLKIITFGPRPEEFFACNAPIQPLYDLGVEVSENSELDLYSSFLKHKDDPRIPEVIADMCAELNIAAPKAKMDVMAQYELTLMDFAEKLKGNRKYVAFANKCWPAFHDFFDFVPCYVNSRMTAKGIPVSCEVDIYGALSEFIGACITNDAVTLLDVNNSVPKEQYMADINGKFDYTHQDVFMGFHCGNTSSCKLVNPKMSYHMICARNTEHKEDWMGTMEGDLVPGKMTFFRLHGTADCRTQAYIARGEVLPVPTQSFGSIGIIAIPEMGRFYRNVLIEKNYPHHGAVAFEDISKVLWEVFKLLGVKDVEFNHPKGMLYENENPFEF